MGFYIETAFPRHKVLQIINDHDAGIIEEREAMSMLREGKGIVVVVENGPFDAAGFAHSEQELMAFLDPYDTRPRTVLVMDRTLAEKLSGYSNRRIYHDDR